MTWVRHPVCRWWSFVENKPASVLAGRQRLFINLTLFPESGDTGFQLREAYGSFNGFKHEVRRFSIGKRLAKSLPQRKRPRHSGRYCHNTNVLRWLYLISKDRHRERAKPR
jgi:hypothetical protein